MNADKPIQDDVESPDDSQRNTTDYSRRINKVIDYINLNLDGDLSVENLSQVAHFSPFHFHRQFTQYTGITVSKLVQLMRLKQASFTLAFNTHTPVTDIALQAGFENPESFSRAFKKVHGQTPSQFRKGPQWQSWQTHSLIQQVQEQNIMELEVELVDFPDTPVAAIEHHGPEHKSYNTTRKLIDWRIANGVRFNQGKTYGVHYSDPRTTLPEDYRLDICVSYDQAVKPNEEGVINKVIPGGRCARIRWVGSRDFIPVVDPLFREWLPASGEELRDYPVFFHYVNVGPDVKPHEMITDVYLPLK